MEVRGRDAKLLWMANLWTPVVSIQSGFHYFYWGLFLEHPALSEPTDADQPRLPRGTQAPTAEAVRDQSLRLEWADLRFVLRRIARVERKPALYRTLFGVKADHVVWDVVECVADREACPTESCSWRS